MDAFKNDLDSIIDCLDSYRRMILTSNDTLSSFSMKVDVLQ